MDQDPDSRYRLKQMKWRGTRAELISLIRAELDRLKAELKAGSEEVQVPTDEDA